MFESKFSIAWLGNSCGYSDIAFRPYGLESMSASNVRLVQTSEGDGEGEEIHTALSTVATLNSADGVERSIVKQGN